MPHPVTRNPVKLTGVHRWDTLKTRRFGASGSTSCVGEAGLSGPGVLEIGLSAAVGFFTIQIHPPPFATWISRAPLSHVTLARRERIHLPDVLLRAQTRPAKDIAELLPEWGRAAREPERAAEADIVEKLAA